MKNKSTGIYIKPVLLGYDVNYCSFSTFEVKITSYYFFFIGIIKTELTCEKN